MPVYVNHFRDLVIENGLSVKRSKSGQVDKENRIDQKINELDDKDFILAIAKQYNLTIDETNAWLNCK